MPRRWPRAAAAAGLAVYAILVAVLLAGQVRRPLSRSSLDARIGELRSTALEGSAVAGQFAHGRTGTAFVTGAGTMLRASAADTRDAISGARPTSASSRRARRATILADRLVAQLGTLSSPRVRPSSAAAARVRLLGLSSELARL